MDTTKNYSDILDIINECSMTSEDVLQLFTNYHGLQIMTDDFKEFVEVETGISY